MGDRSDFKWESKGPEKTTIDTGRSNRNDSFYDKGPLSGWEQW